MSDLKDLFSEESFGFRLTLRRSNWAEFFAPTADGPAMLAEREKWLQRAPGDYAILTESARAAWNEFVDLAAAGCGQSLSPDPAALGTQLEPDIVLLDRGEAGTFRVVGGVVVFPSHWALADKIGLSLREVHGVVPGLNTAIGPAIDTYLDKIKPGFSAGRPNWGLAATDALNLHPATRPPRLIAGMSSDQMWLRIERQLLTSLPHSGAVVFGIRIERVRLATVLLDPEVRRRFHRTIATMPPAVAAYKGLDAVIPDLLAFSA
jgi:hypothetical protein